MLLLDLLGSWSEGRGHLSRLQRAVFHKRLQNGVEIADDRIPKGKFLIAAQAIEKWHKPLDQIGGGLQDR